MKTLIIFRLYDLSYSRNNEYGNKESLRVSLGDDNVLSYSLFGQWQSTGTAFSLSNLQLSTSLPLNPSNFNDIKDLEYAIREILKTGVGSHTVHKAEVLNQLQTITIDKNDKQQLINIMFEVGLVIKENKTLQSQSNEEVAEWIRTQLDGCGFKTKPVGSLWGVLL